MERRARREMTTVHGKREREKERKTEREGERREEEEEKEEQEEDEERAVKDVVRDHCIATADSVEDPEIPQRYAADAKRCAVSTL